MATQYTWTYTRRANGEWHAYGVRPDGGFISQCYSTEAEARRETADDTTREASDRDRYDANRSWRSRGVHM